MSRSTRPYLLSTADTLRKFGILDYDGFDFSMRRDRHRNYRAPIIAKLVLQYLYETIVPNAIVAKRSGKYVEWRDVMRALEYAMTYGKSSESVEAFNDFYHAHKSDWFEEHVKRPVKFYAFDTPYSRKTGEFSAEQLPKDRRWTIERYAREKMDTRKLKPYGHTRTPALNELVTAYSKDRSVADLTTAEFKERFGCSNYTIAKFKAYLREREAKGADSSSLVLPRAQGRKKDAADTAEPDARTA